MRATGVGRAEEERSTMAIRRMERWEMRWGGCVVDIARGGGHGAVGGGGGGKKG